MYSAQESNNLLTLGHTCVFLSQSTSECTSHHLNSHHHDLCEIFSLKQEKKNIRNDRVNHKKTPRSDFTVNNTCITSVNSDTLSTHVYILSGCDFTKNCLNLTLNQIKDLSVKRRHSCLTSYVRSFRNNRSL